MALLSATDLRDVWIEYQRQCSRRGVPLGARKADVQAFLNAVDSWLDSSASQLNQAIPQPARNQLSQEAKMFGLSMVAELRRVKGV